MLERGMINLTLRQAHPVLALRTQKLGRFLPHCVTILSQGRFVRASERKQSTDAHFARAT
jgi:hypothetical protein